MVKDLTLLIEFPPRKPLIFVLIWQGVILRKKIKINNMVVILHVQDKKQKNLLTLKAVTEKEKFPDLVEKKEGKLTLISEEKTYYLYLNKQAGDYNFHKIYNFFVNFSHNNERDINVEVKSFVSDNLKEETVIQAISEGVLFNIYPSITYKKDKKNLKIVNYYLITANKQAKSI